MTGVLKVLHILNHPRKRPSCLSSLWSVLSRPAFFFSIARPSLPIYTKFFSVWSSGWGFCWGQYFKAWYRMSLQLSDSWLRETTDKLNLCSWFPTEMKEKKKSSWSDSGEMGRMCFPSWTSSSSPPHRLHPQCTPTHHLCLFPPSPPTLWLMLLFFGL